MRNYLVILALFFITITQAQIMLPAYQAIQYRRNTFLPTITTSTITAITPSKAVSGGTITSDGGAPVSVRGICWSTTSGPTIALTTKTNDGIGIGSFISNLVLLTPNTTYYVRAYATNSVGTAYGNEFSFTTSPAASLPNVTICNQVWTNKNLDVTTYSDGTPIPQVIDKTAMSNLTTGAWCYYNNDPANNTTYGKLYNWYAAVGIYDSASLSNPALRKSIAPVGWHVPTNADWNTLINCLAPEEALKLKEIGIIHWLADGGSTNSSGFTALPGGMQIPCPSNTITFVTLGVLGGWWSSSDVDSFGILRVFQITHNNNGAALGGNFPSGSCTSQKNFCVSIRCLLN